MHLCLEFSVCDVPVGSSFPIYVKLDGFQPYFVDGASVTPGSMRTVPLANGQTIGKFYATPVTARNFKVFPLNQLVGDYKVQVRYRGAAVEGATVRLVPKNVGNNTIGGVVAVSGEARNSLGNVMSAATDAAGAALFKADKLTFGGEYQLYVYHPKLAAGEGCFLSSFSTSRSFTVGQPTDVAAVDSSFDNDPFSATVELSDAATSKLELVHVTGRTSGGTSVLLPDADGKIVFTFNRDVELTNSGAAFDPDKLVTVAVPNYGTKDVNTACGVADFTLATATASNAVTEVFTATIAGNTLTVTPQFADAALWTAAKAACRGIKLRYTLESSYIRAKDLPGLALTGAAANYDVLTTKE